MKSGCTLHNACTGDGGGVLFAWGGERKTLRLSSRSVLGLPLMPHGVFLIFACGKWGKRSGTEKAFFEET